MSDTLCLKQLDQFDHPGWMIDEFFLLNLLIYGCLQLRVARFLQSKVGEEIIDQGHEERFIFIHKLGYVHVSQHSHHNACLRRLWISSLSNTQSFQHRQDVSQTKVIVNLLGELLLTQFVQSEELPGQGDVLQESTTGKLDSDDDFGGKSPNTSS